VREFDKEHHGSPRHPRRLIERLRAQQACPKSEEPTFLHLPSTGHREWRCDACGAIVDLVSAVANSPGGAR
jgi:hypothetical protein